MMTRELPLGIQLTDRALALQAHPDDELFTATATHDLLAAGVEVHIVNATDGKLSTKGDPDFVKNGQRREELQRSLAIIGVPQEQQHNWELPDGRLHTRGLQRHVTDETEKLIKTLGITIMITPGWFGVDGHPDHKAMHISSINAARRLQRRGQKIGVFALNHLDQGSIPVAADAAFKNQIIRQHHSQYVADPNYYATLAPYHRLLTERETYDRVI